MPISNREEVAMPTEQPKRGGGANPSNATTRPTVISKGTKITGKIRGKSGLVVEGEVKGDLKLEDEVTVAPTGVVNGEIVAPRVRVAGRVNGSVRGLEFVELLSTGSIEGDVTAPRVMIADGAFFKGNVEMGEELSLAAPLARKP